MRRWLGKSKNVGQLQMVQIPGDHGSSPKVFNFLLFSEKCCYNKVVLYFAFPNLKFMMQINFFFFFPLILV